MTKENFMTRISEVALNHLALSLGDLLGSDYVNAVCGAKAFVEQGDRRAYLAIAEEKVDFLPDSFRQRMDELLECVGQKVCDGLPKSAPGAGTASFVKASNVQSAPLTGYGFVRVGEDGRVHLISKSEHYHAALGHSFPGYRLIENAKKLGIPNVTHNNTRGHVTRLVEQELIRVANGIPQGDEQSLHQVLSTAEPHVLNRVINLETGSLAVEAALKMMLARFYRLEDTLEAPEYHDKTPVFLVIADHAGGKKANYHGTTILTQTMRGMWPELSERLEDQQAFVVKPVKINDIAHFQRLLAEYDSGPYKVAGFFHEIVLMNYGGIRLTEDFLTQAYDLCRQRDVPVMLDEIQSCIWYPELFLFREYGLKPDFVSIGKGFPGGEYPASRIITTAAMDNLNQFGALVTNGQEELASVAYLVTMAFVQANQAYVEGLGSYYEDELNALARQFARIVERIEGYRHLSSIVFYSADQATRFAAQLNAAGIDISVQTYKADCPPAALTKLPLISTYKMVDFLIAKMHQALKHL
jgi:acetylornithine/succinyldiaminopimelate/putrescine aminotransferase